MINWRCLLCWPCIVVGIGMSLVSFASYAQSNGTPIDAAAYWRDVALGAIGLVIMLIGAYMRAIDSRMRANETALNRNYLTKEESRQLLEDLLSPLRAQVSNVDRDVRAVHRRLDRLKVPHVPDE